MEKCLKQTNLGNKTLCDICSSKAIKKARAKKEQKETATTPSVEGDHLQETTPPPTPPPIEEGITRNIPPDFSNTTCKYHIKI